MSYVADTNVLLRWSQRQTPESHMARDAIAKIWANGDAVFITPQNMVEFWNVATRPRTSNGFEMTPDEANKTVIELEAIFPLLPDSSAIHVLWRQLVVDHRVCGVKVHDARLAAALSTHGVAYLLTFNDRDFSRFGITAVNPANILNAPS